MAKTKELIREKVNLDCFFFKGHKPCQPHKKHGVHCENCEHYKPLNKKILIIKIGGMGAVVRATPILHKLNEVYPDSRIYWLTLYPELVPKMENLIPLKYSFDSLSILKNMNFDLVLSFDKDLDSCSLAKEINADVKKGFSQEEGVIVPFDKDAFDKYEVGLFDDLMKQNKKNYSEDIFELSGFKWNGEKYIAPEYKLPKIELKTNKKIIGIQTGTSSNYGARAISKEKLISLIPLLLKEYEVVLLGGPGEDPLNREVSEKTGARYFGVIPIKEFIGLVSMCDLLITPVTLVLHLAISLNKKVILLNNVLPSFEFYLYGLGLTLDSNIPCKWCYKSKFDSNCIKEHCLDLINNEDILKAANSLV